jgi:hypothetical protein
LFIVCRANYQVSGLQPLWFHVCNVLLHAAASLLFTRVCLAVAGLQPNFAGAAGVLFAAHPIHTEAVSTALNCITNTGACSLPDLPAKYR